MHLLLSITLATPYLYQAIIKPKDWLFFTCYIHLVFINAGIHVLSIANKIRRYSYNSTLMYNLRMLIAFCGTTFFPWWIGQQHLTIPLSLGVVAAAITDLDDRFSIRLRNLLITYGCFFVAAVSVELLFPFPWLFGIGLFASSIVFILLGSLGQRYATIAFGGLLIAIYTLIGVHLYDTWYQQPVLLLLGAMWYSLLSLAGYLVIPIRQVQDNLARSYEQLAHFLDTKSTLFDPDLDDLYDQTVIDLSLANGALVKTLNATKAALLNRLQGDRGQRSTRRGLHYYFVAQDIHERASSAHVQYQILSQQFRYSDVMFRFQRLLNMQARACQKVSQCIYLRQPYKHSPRFEHAFYHLQTTIERWSKFPQYAMQVNALGLLFANLKAIDGQLANLQLDPNAQLKHINLLDEDNQLSDDGLQTLKDVATRIRQNLNPQSALFRHAIRMSFVLSLGYIIMQVAHLEHGGWILLTSLFVCQPNYNSTKRRVRLRVLGTLAGIAVGLPIIYFVPAVEGKLFLIVLSGVLFFAFRSKQYAHATMFITLLVLLNFSLLGTGFEIAVPRILDTIVGCLIAWFAVSFIWPDWHFRGLKQMVQNSLSAHINYLTAIVEHYHQGRDNSLHYRIARRNAHNSDSELASVISGMSSEPQPDSELINHSFRFLCLSHSLLSYISALGAHREQLNDAVTLTLLDECLNDLKRTLLNDQHQLIDPKTTLKALKQEIENSSPDIGSKEQLVLQQINLIIEVLPELSRLKQILVFDTEDHEASELASL